MAKRPQREIPRTAIDFEKRRQAIRSRLAAESDRGKIIVAAALLDEDLELVIRQRMRKLKSDLDKDIFSGFGPLTTFSGKIKLAFALQMIDEDLYHDLNIMRELRNHFAHAFTDDSAYDEWVESQAANLRYGKTTDKKVESLCFGLAAREERQLNDETWIVAPTATSQILTATFQIGLKLAQLHGNPL